MCVERAADQRRRIARTKRGLDDRVEVAAR